MRSPQLIAAGTATINMTPMIDVVFLLIIFFLVSSHLAKRENSIQLNLPEAASGLDDEAEREVLTVNVLKSGEWQVAGRPQDEAGLSRVMAARVAKNETVRLRIRTDELVPYRKLEPVLRAASQEGIGDIVFSVYEQRP